MKSDVCVVGGGPAGLAAAIALSQSGRQVTLLDSAIPPIDKACGEGLMPDCLAALGKLGVSLTDWGASLTGIRFIDGHSEVTADFPQGMGLAVRRLALHESLVARAQRVGVRLLWGVKNVHTERGRVSFCGGHIDSALIVGADGQNSSIRRQAGLHQVRSENRRYGFRRHYAIAPWSRYVEVYWGSHFQVYVTPSARDQVGVALLSSDPHLRLEQALPLVPALWQKLKQAPAVTRELGSLSVSRKLRRVYSEGYVLVGDASGSIDAITGEGMCLAFQQASALVASLDAGDWRLYERAHEKIASRAGRMAKALLLLDRYPELQRKALCSLAANPALFRSLLAAHVNQQSLTQVLSGQLLSFGFGVLVA